MIKTLNFSVRPYIVLGMILLSLQVLSTRVHGYNRSQEQKFQSSMVDYRSRLNPAFKKVKRQNTDHIIVHTSELGLEATLRVLSRGKGFTPGGHAHYVIARNGQIYQILDPQYRADHAGLSMWNGQSDISKTSVGIELVGYHHSPITESQYHSLARLLDILKKKYQLRDLDVLTHSQVAYGRPNPWFPRDHRGRKRCAKNFDRTQAGLGPGWAYDPDVRSGRLMADPLLADVFYTPRKGQSMQVTAPRTLAESNVISKNNSAWSIAGDEYDSRSTAYFLPGGALIFGDQIGKKIGWDRLPLNTRVVLNQEIQTASIQGQSQGPTRNPALTDTPVKTISNSMTAWSHAGPAYREATTIYFMPSGRVNFGSVISDWDDLPAQTRLIVGYKGPFSITKAQTAFKIAGHKYRDPAIVYYLPPQDLITGDRMTDFANLPPGAQMFLPLN